MAQDKLTAKQQEILEYIKNTILKKGYPPAVRDICEAVKLKSTSSVHSHLSALEEKGYIIVILPSREQLRSWMILLILTGKKW